MTDIFMSEDVIKLLKDRTVVFMGGSVNRGLYKDLVWLINLNTLIPYKCLGSKGEEHFPDLNIVPETSEKMKNVFSDDNVDCLHDCGHCSEDYKGTRKHKHEEGKIFLVF